MYLVALLLQQVTLWTKEACKVAQALVDYVIGVDGVLQTLDTDQDAEFVNCVLLLIRNARIAAFYPSANGVVERVNYTILKASSEP